MRATSSQHLYEWRKKFGHGELATNQVWTETGSDKLHHCRSMYRLLMRTYQANNWCHTVARLGHLFGHVVSFSVFFKTAVFLILNHSVIYLWNSKLLCCHAIVVLLDCYGTQMLSPWEFTFAHKLPCQMLLGLDGEAWGQTGKKIHLLINMSSIRDRLCWNFSIASSIMLCAKIH